MKRIEHRVFVEPELPRPSLWALLFPRTGREQRWERIRRRAETFVNETGVDKVVSITEHAPAFGPFSLVVWWHQDVQDTDTPVIRASDDNRNT